MIIKDVVVFAKSIKHSGYCVAGKTVDKKEWIRIVSDENGNALDDNDLYVANSHWGNKPPYKLTTLQIISFPLVKQAPIPGQPENFILNKIPNTPLMQKYKISNNDIMCYLDFPDSLWVLVIE